MARTLILPFLLSTYSNTLQQVLKQGIRARRASVNCKYKSDKLIVVRSVAEVLVGFLLSQRPDEPSPVVLEAFLLCHLLRGCVLRHGLEERMQKRVVVLPGMHGLEPHVLYSGQRQHHREDRVSPAVEAGVGPKIDQIILELGGDRPREGADGIERNGYDVLLALDDGLGHGALRRQVPRFAVGDESVSVAHEQQSAIVVDPVECGDFGGDVPLQEHHHEVVVDLEPAFGFVVDLSGLRPDAPSHLDILVRCCQILLHVLLVLHWIALGLVL